MAGSGSQADRIVALAAVAHPDDIEFMMAGTLLRLKDAGADIHMWNLANGCCGTATLDKAEITRTRWQEAQASARVAGAVMHPPIADDLGLFFEPRLLASAAAVIRDIKPNIMLVPSPEDYMEDHQNAGRLLVTAAFVRGMRNFASSPDRPPWGGDVVIYHALPHGLRNILRKLVRPGLYVDVGPVLERKRTMLAQHRSQKDWLDVSQGRNAYLIDMEQRSREVGRLSGTFEFAEGWRRHNHPGFSARDRDLLAELLPGFCRVDEDYERSLG